MRACVGKTGAREGLSALTTNPLAYQGRFMDIAAAQKWGAQTCPGGLSVLLGVITSVRLLRWDTGDALICGCGGLLGGERPGRFGTYRTCAACGRRRGVAR